MTEDSYRRLRTIAVGSALVAVALFGFSFLPSVSGQAQSLFGLVVAAQIFIASAIVSRQAPTDLAEENQRELQRLREALTAAEQETEERRAETERFTYIVSHDLRSPLLTIQGFSDILRMDVEEGKAEAIDEDLDHIFKATQRMRQLLDDLLELSRIGRFNEPPVRVELGEIVADALYQVRELAEEKQAEVIIAKDLPTVEVDRNRIQQLYRNLLDNAIRYGREGQAPRIEIGCRSIDGRDELFVKDNGAGMEPEKLEDAFRPFERFSADSVGTGMGLAHSQRIVAYHRGLIRAESDGKGHGSTLIFTLSTPEVVD